MSDGKTAVLTRKSPLEKFASFCGSAAAWLAALVLFGLAAASLIARMDLLDVSTLAEGKALRVGISLPELLLFVVLTALLAGLCRLLRGLDDQKKTNRLIAGAAVLEFALALWWVFSQQIYPANDQFTVWQMAEALAKGDFSRYTVNSYDWMYYQTYPFQGPTALFMELFIRLFGGYALRAWSLFGAVSAPACLLALCCISREFGAGGHSIARVVSERLGIPYYDRDFAKQAAAKSGYSQEDIDREGENLSRSARLLDNILNNSAGYFSSHDAIYQAQKELILQFAAEQDCIIIGRCSNLILRNAGIPSLDIFLHADVNLRTEHIQKLGLNGKEDPRKYLTKMDNLRETYFKTYTKHELGTYHDYDLCLDTGTLGYDNCIEIITSLAKQQGLNLKHQ